MERLSNLTRHLVQKQFDPSWTILDGRFVGGQTRHIKGVVVSGLNPNSNGDSFLAAGMEPVNGYLPLLLEHDPFKPLGRVTRVKAIGHHVFFEAEICRGFYVAEEVWKMIAERTVIGISQGSTNLKPDGTSVLKSWRLNEISVVGNPADPLAHIGKCWERPTYVSLTQPQEIVFWELA